MHKLLQLLVLQVQEDLHSLHEKLNAQGDIQKGSSYAEIEAALCRTEDSIKVIEITCTK